MLHFTLRTAIFLTAMSSCTMYRSFSSVKDDTTPVTFTNAPLTRPSDRFDVLLNQIQNYINGAANIVDPTAKANFFMSSGVIGPLRIFQELITIYGDKYEDLKPFGEEAHTFENFISHIGDQQNFVRIAQGSGNAAAIAAAQTTLANTKAEFVTYVAQSSWFAAEPQSMVTQIKTRLTDLASVSLEKDRNYILKQIAKKMKKQHEKVYNLDAVEEGIHEMRRDSRRLSYLNQAATSVIRSDRPGACPLLTIQQWDALPDADKANVVPNVVPEPHDTATTDYFCHVSACLTSKLDSISISLASLKGQGANYLAQGLPVPQQIFDQGKAYHDELTKSLVYMFLWTQIKSCQTPDNSSGGNNPVTGNDTTPASSGSGGNSPIATPVASPVPVATPEGGN